MTPAPFICCEKVLKQAKKVFEDGEDGCRFSDASLLDHPPRNCGADGAETEAEDDTTDNELAQREGRTHDDGADDLNDGPYHDCAQAAELIAEL
ncbi:hypothetical protein FOPE_00704 [Fonsecaea pedrosoi]|nr:hypothetical protein FOPE_00704 [Fonsecaea pedrosoi]